MDHKARPLPEVFLEGHNPSPCILVPMSGGSARLDKKVGIAKLNYITTTQTPSTLLLGPLDPKNTPSNTLEIPHRSLKEPLKNPLMYWALRTLKP